MVVGNGICFSKHKSATISLLPFCGAAACTRPESSAAAAEIFLSSSQVDLNRKNMGLCYVAWRIFGPDVSTLGLIVKGDSCGTVLLTVAERIGIPSAASFTRGGPGERL
jgi:hypothetical protein